jgi:hypothetical protein
MRHSRMSHLTHPYEVRKAVIQSPLHPLRQRLHPFRITPPAIAPFSLHSSLTSPPASLSRLC